MICKISTGIHRSKQIIKNEHTVIIYGRNINKVVNLKLQRQEGMI